MGSEVEKMVDSKLAIEHRSYARVGLMGNPSDAYFGKTISFLLGNFWASVKLQPSKDLAINPHPVHDFVEFSSIRHLVRYLQFTLPSRISDFRFFQEFCFWDFFLLISNWNSSDFTRFLLQYQFGLLILFYNIELDLDVRIRS